MKKQFLPTLILTLLLGIISYTTTQAQCNDLFISEYVEGSHNNKALEIYNPTDNSIDLSDYRIIRWSNGNATYNDLYKIDLTGYTIAAKDVFVLALDKQDCTQTGQDTCLFEELIAKADAFYSPVYEENRTLYHNGNDAISLNKISDNTQFPFGAFVDIFGLIGENPGPSPSSSGGVWTDTSPYVQTAGGTWWTRNKTLIRRCTITEGMKQNPGIPYTGAWNPSEEWDTLSINTFSELGTHTCACETECPIVGIEEAVDNVFTVYPNPIDNQQFTITSNQLIVTIELYSITGQLVQSALVNNQVKTMTTNDLPTGTYLVKVQYRNGNTAIEKVVIR